MRYILLIGIATIFMSSQTYSMPNDKTFQYLAMFYAANENCTGQFFNKKALVDTMHQIGKEQGWTKEKVNEEIERQYIVNMTNYKDDVASLCAAASTSTKQDATYLKSLGIIN